jgi:ParB/RepB/Spo0J family partition protein
MNNLNLFRAAQCNIQSLPTAMIRPDPSQPRRDFETEALAELADSIAENGILSPIMVATMADGFHQIVYGERRWRAARMVGLKEMPCIVSTGVVNSASASERKIVQLAENAHHRDLSDLEYVDAIGELSANGWTTDAIAKKTGKRTRWVKLVLELAHNLPMRALLETGRMSSVEVYAHFSGLVAEARRELLDAGGRITSVDCARMREKYRNLEEKRQTRLQLVSQEDAEKKTEAEIPDEEFTNPCHKGHPRSELSHTESTSSFPSSQMPVSRVSHPKGRNENGREARSEGSPSFEAGSQAHEIMDASALPTFHEAGNAQALLYVRIPREWFDETQDPEYLEQICIDAIRAAKETGWHGLPALRVAKA